MAHYYNFSSGLFNQMGQWSASKNFKCSLVPSSASAWSGTGASDSDAAVPSKNLSKCSQMTGLWNRLYWEKFATLPSRGGDVPTKVRGRRWMPGPIHRFKWFLVIILAELAEHWFQTSIGWRRNHKVVGLLDSVVEECTGHQDELNNQSPGSSGLRDP